MARKLNLDKDGELKKLADEFEAMHSEEDLREQTEAAEAKVTAQYSGLSRKARPRSVIIGAIVAVIALAALLVGGKYLWFRHPVQQRVTVPSVFGLTKQAAQATMVKAHFRVQYSYNPGSTATPNTVISQQPNPGESAPDGAEVKIVVAGVDPDLQQNPSPTPVNPISQGDTIPLPDYVGMEEAKAQSKLEKAGFIVQVVQGTDNAHPVGVVLDSDPKPDTPVAKGATICLKVNNLTPQMLPDYSGKQAEAVLGDLKSHGYDAVQADVPSTAQAPGIVLGTEPKANSAVKPGEKVTVIVAK